MIGCGKVVWTFCLFVCCWLMKCFFNTKMKLNYFFGFHFRYVIVSGLFMFFFKSWKFWVEFVMIWEELIIMEFSTGHSHFSQ